MPKKLWQILLGAVATVVVLPLAIDWLIIGNSFPSNITNSDWVGFFGGYIGSILGCVISLVGILWTINFTREQNRADRELQIRPYLDIRYNPSVNMLEKGKQWLGYVMINEWDDNKAENRDVERGLLYLKNVGNGPATNIDVGVFVENIKVKHSARFTNQNLKVTANSIQQGEEAAVSLWITNNRIPPTKDDIVWEEDGFAHYSDTKFPMPSNYNVTLVLHYNDLLGNRFSQELKFNARYHMQFDKENGGKYGCNLALNEIGVPEKETKQSRKK